MSTSVATFLLLLTMVAFTSGHQQFNPVQVALDGVLQAKNWVQISSVKLHELRSDDISNYGDLALRDCAQLYYESVSRLTVLLSNESNYTDDAHYHGSVKCLLTIGLVRMAWRRRVLLRLIMQWHKP